MVNVSPWPLFTSFSLLNLVLNIVTYFHFYAAGIFYIQSSLFMLCFFLFRWFYDIVVESTYEGNHTFKVQQGVKLGMCLFIVSEIMFFFSFFWSFFHCSLSPSISIGCIWPQKAIITMDPWGLPLWNTIILLSSGVTITYAHKALIVGDRSYTMLGIFYTIVYGSIFTIVQGYEYTVAPFSLNDGIFGSLFFLLTGFHGLHVFIGSLFLFICLVRHLQYHFLVNQHIGFECAAWYWHFVDVVWLGLFLLVYIWGG